MDLPRVYVARRLPQPALDLLARHVQLTIWPGELPPPRAVLLNELSEADGLLSLLTERIDQPLLERARRLRVVSNYAVGYDNIDLDAATQYGVLVTNTPGVLAETVADFTLGLMLSAARRMVEAQQYVRAGRWRTWGPEVLLGRDIYGATLGLVGLGEIGRAVARRAAGFGMQVLYTAPSPKPDVEAELGLQFVSLPELLSASDIISLHCPLNDQTYQLIDREALALLKPDAILINTARGPIVDTQALVEALRTRPIIAALDVTDPEPLPSDHPLIGLPNALITPHIASASVQTRTRMALMAAENLLAALRGERPPNLLNPRAWHNPRMLILGET